MNPTSSPAMAAPFYLEILAFLVALSVALGLHLASGRALRHLRQAGLEAIANFLGRISFPAFCLGVALILWLPSFREAFSFRPRFAAYAEAAVIFFAVILLIRIIDASLLYRYQRRRLHFPLPDVLHGFILIVLYLTIFFIVLRGILGINITPLLATSAIFTAIIGLAFQGVLSNVLAGISLNLTKSLSRGDWVKIGPHEGVVMEMNWRETLIFDRASNLIVIPNSTVAAEMIVNFSRPEKATALTIPIKVSYTAPPALVLEELRSAAREVPEVLTTPVPQAYILSYDDFGISYLLKFWVTDFSRKYAIVADVARHIWYKFKRSNIEIPVSVADQVREVLGAVREEKRVAAQEEEKDKNYADLLRSSLLRFQEGERAGELIVPEEGLRQLAGLVHRQRYTKGEVLFRQGERGESCFLVASGEIKGEIVYEEKGKRYAKEFRVGPGGIFGEMSLFTGMPRTATGTIDKDAELLEIRAADFAFLLNEYPGVAEVIADLVSERNRKNEAFLRQIKELSAADIDSSVNKQSILARLKRLILSFRKLP